MIGTTMIGAVYPMSPVLTKEIKVEGFLKTIPISKIIDAFDEIKMPSIKKIEQKKKISRKRKSKNSAEFYFKKVGYEKAIIRHEVLDHFHRYYIIILIVIGVFVGVGLNAIHEGTQEENPATLEEYSQSALRIGS